MRKILVTTKLLKPNEDRISKLLQAKLNLNNEIYSKEKLVELSKDCDGILCSIVDKFDAKTINKLSNTVKIISSKFICGFKFKQDSISVFANSSDSLNNSDKVLSL